MCSKHFCRLCGIVFHFHIRLVVNHSDYIQMEQIGIGADLTISLLPHHRTYGSVYGGSVMLIVACLYLWQVQSGEQVIGECYVQRRATAYPPLFMAASHRLRCEVFAYTPTAQLPEALAARFPLFPEYTSQPAPYPSVQFPHQRRPLVQHVVAFPARQISL